MQQTSVTEDVRAPIDRIRALQDRHAALDARLAEEAGRPMPDDYTVATLKRQKLAIKDQIARLSAY